MKSLLSAFTMILFCLSSQIQAAPLKAPKVGAYHGAFAGFGAAEEDVTVERIRDFERLAGKGLAWAYFSNVWRDGNLVFPSSQVAACQKAGVIPYVRLMPWSDEEQNHRDPIFTMDRFLAGNFNQAWLSWVRAAKATNTHLMLEFGPEVNGRWFPWNGIWNGGSKSDGYGDPFWPDGPEKFRDVYRGLIQLARQEGLTNVTWILHIDTSGDPESEWNQIKNYYPGDDYIDWIGLSVFGAQLPTHDWDFFEMKLKRFMPQINAMTKTKPLLISEFGVIEGQWGPEAKANWIRRALGSIEKGLFPQIKGISYWHSDGWAGYKNASFRVDSSEQSLESYRKAISTEFWKSTSEVSP